MRSINAKGFDLARKFIESKCKYEAVLKSATVISYLYDAERRMQEGGEPSFEIPAHLTKSGEVETFTIPQEGLEG